MVLKRKLNTSIILLTLLVLTSGSVLNVLGIDEFLVISLFAVVLMLSARAGLLARKGFVLIALLTSLILLLLFALQAIDAGDFSTVLNRNNIKVILLVATCLMSAYFLQLRRDFIDQLHVVLLVFTIHGVLSCIIFSLFPTQNVLFSSVDLKDKYLGYWPFVLQRAHVNYFGVVELSWVDLLGIKISRAHGLAWEPGNFASIVNVFVFINLFIRRNYRSAMIGVIAVILSFSTNGFLVLLLQCSAYAVSNYRTVLRKNLVLKLFIAPVLLAVLVTLSVDNINEKIYGDSSGSGATRVVNTYSALVTIGNNPLLGTGFSFMNYSNELNKSIEASRKALDSYVAADLVGQVSSTNSFLRLYVQGGIPIALLFTISLFSQTLIPKHKFIFGLLLIISASAAPLMLTPFYFLFVLSGLLNLWGFKYAS